MGGLAMGIIKTIFYMDLEMVCRFKMQWTSYTFSMQFKRSISVMVIWDVSKIWRAENRYLTSNTLNIFFSGS